MTDKQRAEILESCVSRLSEVFDAVQVMGTFLRPEGGTSCSKRGSGNMYARIGMAREFLQEDEAADHASQIAAKLDPPDDSWKT